MHTPSVHNGRPLAVGQRVLIPAEIVAVRWHGGRACLEVRTTHTQGDGKVKTVLCVQDCQVEVPPFRATPRWVAPGKSRDDSEVYAPADRTVCRSAGDDLDASCP